MEESRWEGTGEGGEGGGGHRGGRRGGGRKEEEREWRGCGEQGHAEWKGYRRVERRRTCREGEDMRE